MKKVLSTMGLLLLTSILMVGCGAPKPKDTVKDFFTAFKDSDLKKANTYVKGDIHLPGESGNGDKVENEKGLKAIAKRFSFKEPKTVSSAKDKAVVSAKVTSVDVSDATKKVIEELKPQLNSLQDLDEVEFDEKANELLIQKLADKNIDLVTRTVKLNLKKNKDGEYQIINDDQLMDVFFANKDKVQDVLQSME